MQDLSIRSLLKVGKGRKFVPIEEYEGITRSDYIEGAIVIRANGRTLLDERQWDMIDQLWCYISDGLVQVSLGNDFKTYFPDDPAWIGFELDRDSRTAKLSVYTGTLKQAALETRSLIAGFSEAAVFSSSG